MRRVLLAAGAGLAMGSSAMAQWTTSSIQNGDVRFQVPAGTTGGGAFGAAFTSTTSSAASLTSDFRTTGATGTDHTFSLWWWYRANNDTRERNIASPAGSAAVTKNVSADAVEYLGIQPETTGANSALRFDLSFRVEDLDGPGGNQGRLISILTVRNTGSTTASGVNLFSYVDYFFGGQDAGDFVPTGEAAAGMGGRFIRVQDTTNAAAFGSMFHYGAGATGFGVGSFSLVGGQMGDTSVDDFNDFNSATTPGDQSGVLQWTFGDVEAGGSRSAMMILAIPAPGSIALLGLGGLMAARRRRA